MLSTVFSPGVTDGITVTLAITIGATGDAVEAAGRLLVCPLATTCVLPLLFVWSTTVVAEFPDQITVEEPTLSV